MWPGHTTCAGSFSATYIASPAPLNDAASIEQVTLTSVLLVWVSPSTVPAQTTAAVSMVGVGVEPGYVVGVGAEYVGEDRIARACTSGAVVIAKLERKPAA
jgi:hypothetical protein